MLVLVLACTLITLQFEGSEFTYAYVSSLSQQEERSPLYERSDPSISQADFISNESPLNHSSELQDEQIKTVTIVDYAEPAPPSRLNGSFIASATDPCGDGTNQFTTNNGGVHWQSFPVTYAIDTANSGVDPTAARNAVIDAFEEFDTYMPGQAFQLINDYNAATIKFRWSFLDGNLGQVGQASYSYNPSTLALSSAVITLDSGDNWFVSSVQSCGSAGSSLDIQNIGAHELGHAVGLGHVSDNLLTMYPTSFTGETLKRSLGLGDRAGMEFLYPSGSVSWSQWNGLGGAGRDNSDPTVIANADGRLDVFVAGTNNALYHKSQTSAGSSTWSAWQSLGGAIDANTSPAVARNSDGRLEAFVVGTNNQLYHKWQISAGSGTWSAWQSLGGGLRDNSDPIVVANSDGRLEIFVVQSDNALYHKWQSAAGSSTWSAYQPLGGIIRQNTSPAVASNADGRLDVFVVGSNNALYHKWQTSAGSSTWSTYALLGGIIDINTSPAVARNSDGRLDAFVVGSDNQLYHKWQTSAGSSTWSTYASLGGTLRDNSDPAVIVNSDGRLEVFVVGTNNQLSHKWQTSAGSSTWSTYESLGGLVKAGTSAAIGKNSDDRLQVFVVGTNSGIFHKWQIIS